jgi:TolB-like protein
VIGAVVAALSISLIWTPWSTQQRAQVAAARPGLSIVVLPLASEGGDPAQDRLAAALTDEITVDLSRIPETFVIARATADSYRGRSVDARQVGRELGVRYVLDGGMVRLGDAVRLTLQLVDSESGRALWGDRIDGELPDLPALYRRVTGTVARSLDLTLQEAETARARARPGADLQDLLLQARWLLKFPRATPDSVQQARQLLEQASARDPGVGTRLRAAGADLQHRRGAALAEPARRDARAVAATGRPALGAGLPTGSRRCACRRRAW